MYGVVFCIKRAPVLYSLYLSLEVGVRHHSHDAVIVFNSKHSAHPLTTSKSTTSLMNTVVLWNALLTDVAVFDVTPGEVIHTSWSDKRNLTGTFSMYCFVDHCLAIVSYVLLRFMASYYPIWYLQTFLAVHIIYFKEIFLIFNRWQQEMKMWYPASSRTNLE